jgi:erythromycin esterase
VEGRDVPRTSLTLLAGVAALMTGAAALAAQTRSDEAVRSWVRARLTSLTTQDSAAAPASLSGLKSVIGNARVIGLGEGAHGVQEFLATRNRLLELLVEQGGVTAIAAETGYTESAAVDDYVLGGGRLDAATIGSVFSWSVGTPYLENETLIEWIRAFNARPTTKRKVRFYGLDLTGGRGGQFSQTHLALDAALAYVATVDSASAKGFRDRFSPFAGRFTSAGFDSLSIAERSGVSSVIADLVGLFERRQVAWIDRTSADAYDRSYRNAVMLRELDANFRAAREESNPQAQREAAMAHNLLWVLQHEGAGGRVLLYEANWHVSKGPMSTDRFGSSLGEHLHAMLGPDYVAIGTMCGASEQNIVAPPDSSGLASLASRLHIPAFILALRDIPADGPVGEWFRAPRPLQAGRNDVMVVNRAFDAVVYFDAVHLAARARL